MDDGYSFSFSIGFSVEASICGEESSPGSSSISHSAAERMVLDFWKEAAASVIPRKPVKIASAALRKRILRRRETRAILKEYYASKQKLSPSKETTKNCDNRRPPHKSRQKHAQSRPRIKGRFATKEEIAAMDDTTTACCINNGNSNSNT